MTHCPKITTSVTDMTKKFLSCSIHLWENYLQNSRLAAWEATGRSTTTWARCCHQTCFSSWRVWGWFTTPLGAMRRIVMSMTVCLSVCRLRNSKTAQPEFTKFFCLLPVTVAQSSSDGVAICYVLLVLWRHCNTLCTSCSIDDIMFSYHGTSGQNQAWRYVWRSSPGGGTIWTSDN